MLCRGFPVGFVRLSWLWYFALLPLSGFGKTLVDLSSRGQYATWKLCRKDLLDALNVTAKDVSMPGFSSTPLYASLCFPAVVPGTAMVSMLENGMFPGVTDPYQHRQYHVDVAKTPHRPMQHVPGCESGLNLSSSFLPKLAHPLGACFCC